MPRCCTPPATAPAQSRMLFQNGDAIIGDILRGGVMGGMFLSSRPKYPFFLYDLADKPVILDSVQSGPRPRRAASLHRPRRPAAARGRGAMAGKAAPAREVDLTAVIREARTAQMKALAERYPDRERASGRRISPSVVRLGPTVGGREAARDDHQEPSWRPRRRGSILTASR